MRLDPKKIATARLVVLRHRQGQSTEMGRAVDDLALAVLSQIADRLLAEASSPTRLADGWRASV